MVMVGVFRLDFAGRLGHASLKATAVPSLKMAEFRHFPDSPLAPDSEKHHQIAKYSIHDGEIHHRARMR
ncbi:hypothetical protein [Niveispirillum sp. BGYR6]|uniref:hypothetical protein n=1 Tax=Niveispirillum sp. BGYR6 TaxID=2971249 RepID=UPI0022B96C9E|nr:hypothetical protein [Niveispirillum sp. BGYR6]MDG5495214.1 hypothetical protein [Niveispirillum sp. BGYR6]